MRNNCKVDHSEGTKKCPVCLKTKGLGDFSVRKSGYVYAYCKPCSARKAREWTVHNKQKKASTNAKWAALRADHVRMRAKDNHYRRRFGVSWDEIMSMLEKQEFMCAICNTDLSDTKLVADHCHTTGKIRGILCNQCNIWLAPLERQAFLERATAYIERHRSAG